MLLKCGAPESQYLPERFQISIIIEKMKIVIKRRDDRQANKYGWRNGSDPSLALLQTTGPTTHWERGMRDGMVAVITYQLQTLQSEGRVGKDSCQDMACHVRSLLRALTSVQIGR